MTKIPTSNLLTTDLCRICLSRENVSNSIFSNSLLNNTIFAQFFMACTSVQILIDDGLPSLICDNCLESLKSFINLCKQCINSDLVLRNNQISCVKNSFHQLKNDDIVIKTEEDSVKEWQEYTSESRDVIEDDYSSFVFVTVEDRIDESRIKWCQEEINIKKENESLEQHSDKEMCLIKNHVVNNRIKKNPLKRIKKTISESQSNKILLSNKNRKIKKGSKIHQYQCHKCGKQYSKKCSLILHDRTHTGERPYKCSLCPKSFAQKITLNIHSLTHSGERPFNCNECGKSFTQKTNLLTHMNAHTSEQQFHCNICLKKFSRKTSLTLHVLTHSGERPYECKTCKKRFSLKGTLKRHETIHSNLKPFKCKTCSKTFSRKNNCRVHEQIHSGEKPYKCEVCHRAFGRKDKMKEHLKTHSNKNRKSVK